VCSGLYLSEGCYVNNVDARNLGHDAGYVLPVIFYLCTYYDTLM
jgi:hypothetical protein